MHFKTVQQSAKDKEDICRRADARQKISDAGFHTLMGWIKMHYLEDCYNNDDDNQIQIQKVSD